MKIHNITKLYISTAVLLFLMSLTFIPNTEFYNGGINIGASSDETISVQVSAGETLHIEFTNFSGNLTLKILEARARENLYIITSDTKLVLKFDYSFSELIFLEGIRSSSANLKIYVTGVSVVIPIFISVSSILLLVAFVVEFRLKKVKITTYFVDEVQSLNVPLLLSTLVVAQAFIWEIGINETGYVDSTEPYYVWDVHVYLIVLKAMGLIGQPLIFILIALTFMRLSKKETTRIYSVYPINTTTQYWNRITVYLLTVFPIQTLIYWFAVLHKNGNFQGVSKLLPTYLPAFILTLILSGFFVFLHVLSTDLVKIDYLGVSIVPLSILIGIIFYLTFPPFSFLNLPRESWTFDTLFEVVFVMGLQFLALFAVVVYFNLRARRSPMFIAN